MWGSIERSKGRGGYVEYEMRRGWKGERGEDFYEV
jgi:hypothetical protein